jgi:hypothetical protein
VEEPLTLRNPVAALRRRLRSMSLAVDDVRDHVSGLERELEELRRENARHRDILLALRDREPDQRDRLDQLRRSASYELAFTEATPLVSVIIPTYDNYERLADRSIPSVQAQTWQHFEVLVVGDAAPEAARAVVQSIGDERVRFWNRTYRGPYPENPRDRWHIAGVPPYNEAAAAARGRWIAHLGDDDALRPHHLESLLDRARGDRLELCYGLANTRTPDGTTAPLVGRFPPEWGQFCFQAAIYHAGLAPIFPAEMTDALFEMPWDWGLCRRMMRAGVRMGMVDSIVVDGYPSARWIGREGASSV